MKIINKEVSLKMIASTIGSLAVIVGLGWTGNQMYEAKADKVELASSQIDQDVRVYDVLIEEAQDDLYDLKHKGGALNSREVRQIDVLEDRIEKYEKRQERLLNEK